MKCVKDGLTNIKLRLSAETVYLNAYSADNTLGNRLLIHWSYMNDVNVQWPSCLLCVLHWAYLFRTDSNSHHNGCAFRKNIRIQTPIMQIHLARCCIMRACLCMIWLMDKKNVLCPTKQPTLIIEIISQINVFDCASTVSRDSMPRRINSFFAQYTQCRPISSMWCLF